MIDLFVEKYHFHEIKLCMDEYISNEKEKEKLGE